MSKLTENIVINDTSLTFQTGTTANETDWLFNISTSLPKTGVNLSKELLKRNRHLGVPQTVQELVIQSTTEIAQNLQHITTIKLDIVNNSHPEVTIRKPEVTSESDSFGTAEKVVVGAAIVVAVLAVVALLLRILGPYFRSKNSNIEKDKGNIFTPEVFISKLR